MSLLLDAYPTEWRRLQAQVQRISQESGLELSVDAVFVKGAHLVAAFRASEGRQATTLYFSTPIDERAKHKPWWRGSVA
jgi:hypothetical protein